MQSSPGSYIAHLSRSAADIDKVWAVSILNYTATSVMERADSTIHNADLLHSITVNLLLKLPLVCGRGRESSRDPSHLVAVRIFR